MLKNLVAATLYTALSLSAIPAGAGDLESLGALRDGDMKKLVIHAAPKPTSDAVFTDFEGQEMSLADFEGEVVVVNFWATWCAPCRKEMPSLDALAARYENADVRVLPIATGHNPRPAISRFLEDIEVSTLETALDPKSALAREMAVLGLPITVILDRDGREIARLTGDADWASPSAFAIIDAVANISQ